MSDPARFRPDWDTDGREWPNRAHSRFLSVDGLAMHVQRAGAGPTLLLLHGTGASTHSFADLFERLAASHDVIVPDLPGHGFTDMPGRPAQMSLPGMGHRIGALLAQLGARPRAVIGHSAGAAILCRMAIDGLIAPTSLFSLNGALLPPRFMPLPVFSPLARLFSATSLVPRIFAWHAADRAVVDRLLASTGSRVPAASAALYARLARRPGHAAGALQMMAQWDLGALQRDLPQLPCPLVMINGSQDRTIPATEARRVQQILPSCELVTLPGLGHLAHEEQPAEVASLILARLAPNVATAVAPNVAPDITPDMPGHLRGAA